MMSLQARAQVKGTAEVDRLLHELQHNLKEAKLSLVEQEKLLGQVKVYGRDPSTAGSIFAEKGISTLSKYGFGSESPTVSREALRCLANAFLLHEPARQIFVNLGFAPKAAERLKVDDLDDEFLISRILFFLTYNTKLDFTDLVQNNHLTESINRHMAHHGDRVSRSEMQAKSPPIGDMAMAETLKLLFNITYYYPDLISGFTPAIKPLIDTLLHHPLPNPPLQSPITYLLNALLNLDLKLSEEKAPLAKEANSSPLFPSAHPESVVERLTSILYKAVCEHQEKELDQTAAPLCTLIRRVYELASPHVKISMQQLLLPTEADREKPLGQGETLSARLLQLSSSPNLPTLRDNISSLLFELSDKDPNKFVKNIGYGFASGFLMSHNIAVPADSMKAGSTNKDDSTNLDAEVNPITGQRWSAQDEGKSNLPEMTEEEKEREAERLFVLFERLRATDVVDVKNPVQQALDEGRFEELDD